MSSAKGKQTDKEKKNESRKKKPVNSPWLLANPLPSISEFRKHTLPFHESLVSAVLGNSSIVDNQDTIAHAHYSKFMRDHDRSPANLGPLDCLQNRSLVRRI